MNYLVLGFPTLFMCAAIMSFYKYNIIIIINYLVILLNTYRSNSATHEIFNRAQWFTNSSLFVNSTWPAKQIREVLTIFSLFLRTASSVQACSVFKSIPHRDNLASQQLYATECILKLNMFVPPQKKNKYIVHPTVSLSTIFQAGKIMEFILNPTENPYQYREMHQRNHHWSGISAFFKKNPISSWMGSFSRLCTTENYWIIS